MRYILFNYCYLQTVLVNMIENLVSLAVIFSLAPLLATRLDSLLSPPPLITYPRPHPYSRIKLVAMTGSKDSSTAPCGVCDREVSWSHKGINCDTCGLWFHAHCQDIGSRTYSNLGDEDITWHCVICGNAKRSTTAYDLHGVEQETLELSSHPDHEQFRPNHSSTPTHVSRQNKQKF